MGTDLRFYCRKCNVIFYRATDFVKHKHINQPLREEKNDSKQKSNTV